MCLRFGYDSVVFRTGKRRLGMSCFGDGNLMLGMGVGFAPI